MFIVSRRCTLAAVAVLSLIPGVLSAQTNGRPFQDLRQELESLRSQVEELAARLEQGGTGPANVAVDCAAGQSIAAALTTPGTPLTVTIEGTCQENIVVDRDDVTLVAGSAGATIHALIGYTVLVRGDRFTLDGLTITGNSNGIVLVGASNFSVRNCIVGPTSRVGIVLYQASQGSVDNCTIRNNAVDGIFLQSAIATVINNTISNNGRTGIFMSNNAAARIGITNETEPAGNTISDNADAGIHVSLGANALVVANTVSANGTYGIGLFEATADIAGNRIEGNGAQGVLLQSARALFGDSLLSSEPNVIIANGTSGVHAGVGSTVRIRNTGIVNNNGSGLTLTLRSTATNSGRIQGNAGDGVVVQSGSGLFTDGTITANGGFGVRCFGATPNVLNVGPVFANGFGDVDPACRPF